MTVVRGEGFWCQNREKRGSREEKSKNPKIYTKQEGTPEVSTFPKFTPHCMTWLVSL